MSGPKHLWSGDWQRESAAASDRLAESELHEPPAPPKPRPAPVKATPAPPRAKPAGGPARPRRRVTLRQRPGTGRAVAVVAVALLVIAAGALGLTALLSSSGSNASTTAAATALGSSKSVSWLGMEIQTLPPGAAVVESVGLGSEGDRVGLQPGDVIVEVNNRVIDGAEGIAPAIRGLHAGDQIQMQVSHGSGIYLIDATLAAPPTVHP